MPTLSNVELFFLLLSSVLFPLLIFIIQKLFSIESRLARLEQHVKDLKIYVLNIRNNSDPQHDCSDKSVSEEGTGTRPH